MATLELSDVTKIYPNGQAAVDGLDLTVEDGETLMLLGPSGCGKSTTLRMVAGLEAVTGGDVRLDGQRINDTPPKDRDVAMVFQNYALYPHLTVEQNIGLCLRVAGKSRREVRDRVQAIARLLELEALLDQTPATLSGGQSQRVAIGRALVREPRLFLLDEPLSALDAKLRVRTRADLGVLLKRLGVTTMYVTHDQNEAMSLGDRVAVLNGGRVEQVGTSQELYSTPANVFVAGFVGSPAMNLLRANVVDRGDGLAVTIGSTQLPVTDARTAARLAARERADTDVIVGIRPEQLGLPDPTTPPERRLRGEVTMVEALGSELVVGISVPTAVGHGDVVARLKMGPIPHVGSTMELAVPDDTVLYVFDPDSGATLMS